jgi:hypothetical protein
VSAATFSIPSDSLLSLVFHLPGDTTMAFMVSSVEFDILRI